MGEEKETKILRGKNRILFAIFEVDLGYYQIEFNQLYTEIQDLS